MSIKNKDFEVQLLKLTPELRRIVAAFRFKRFCGIYDNDDLYQEVVLRLWSKIPILFDPKKGNLKAYCMITAFMLLKRIAFREYKQLSNVNVDFAVFDQYKKFDCNSSIPEDIRNQLVEVMKMSPDRNSTMIKLRLQELVHLNKDYSIIKLLYENDGNRKHVCKVIKRSNAYITKVVSKFRRKRYLLKIPTDMRKFL